MGQHSELQKQLAPLNILLICTVFPYPPNDGTKIQIYQRLKHLAQRNHITLLCLHSEVIEPSQIAYIKRYCDPHLFKLSASQNSRNLIEKIWNFQRSLWRMTPYFLFDLLANKVIQQWLEERISAAQFDIIETDSVASSFLKKTWRPFKIFIVHNVENAALTREIILQKNLYLKLRTLAYYYINRRFQRKICKTADLCVALTDDIRSELQQLDPAIVALPCLTNGVDLDYFQFLEPVAEPTGACFVGKMDYWPNIDAVLYFYHEILPIIRARHSAFKFYIVGVRPTRPVLALAEDPQVEVTGSVEDVRPYLRKAGIAVVPTRAGGGILNKTLEALALGVPVVTRSRSVEGLQVRSGKELLLADRPEAFAEGVSRLFTDAQLRVQLAHNGRRYVENHHRWEQIILHYELTLRELLAKRSAEAHALPTQKTT